MTLLDAIPNEEHVLRIINPLGRAIDETSSPVDARLPDGSRVNASIAPLSLVDVRISVGMDDANEDTPARFAPAASSTISVSDIKRR